MDPSYQPQFFPSPRLHHCMALQSQRAKTSAHLYSYFPSVIKLWNKLPSEFISICQYTSHLQTSTQFTCIYYNLLLTHTCILCALLIIIVYSHSYTMCNYQLYTHTCILCALYIILYSLFYYFLEVCKLAFFCAK